MRATINPKPILLTKGCIVPSVLPLRSFLLLLPTYVHNLNQLYYVTRREYCYMNTSSLQLSMLLAAP